MPSTIVSMGLGPLSMLRRRGGFHVLNGLRSCEEQIHRRSITTRFTCCYCTRLILSDSNKASSFGLTCKIMPFLGRFHQDAGPTTPFFPGSRQFRTIYLGYICKLSYTSMQYTSTSFYLLSTLLRSVSPKPAVHTQNGQNASWMGVSGLCKMGVPIDHEISHAFQRRACRSISNSSIHRCLARFSIVN